MAKGAHDIIQWCSIQIGCTFISPILNLLNKICTVGLIWIFYRINKSQSNSLKVDGGGQMWHVCVSVCITYQTKYNTCMDFVSLNIVLIDDRNRFSPMTTH